MEISKIGFLSPPQSSPNQNLSIKKIIAFLLFHTIQILENHIIARLYLPLYTFGLACLSLSVDISICELFGRAYANNL